MSGVDEGVAGAVGAAVVGVGLGIREFVAHVRGKASRGAPDLGARVTALEREMRAMKRDMSIKVEKLGEISGKLEKLAESVDELCIGHARADEIGVHMREQLKEIREELRLQRRSKEAP